MSATRVKAINRAADRGRTGHHEGQPERQTLRQTRPKGRIVEAYGFDLSPIATRMPSLCGWPRRPRRARAHAPAAPTGHDRPQRHRPDPRNRRRVRASAARSGVTLKREGRTSPSRSGRSNGPRRWSSASKAWNAGRWRANGWKSCSPRHASTSEAVDSDPKGPENGPHQYTYKPNLNPQQDTVIASEECKSGRRAVVRTRHRTVGAERAPGRTGAGGADRQTAPCCSSRPTSWCGWRRGCRPYLRDSRPGLAGNRRRRRLPARRSRRLEIPLGEACLAMGREQAAIAIAIVSTKPAEHFGPRPGGYFHGMVRRPRPASSISTGPSGACASIQAARPAGLGPSGSSEGRILEFMKTGTPLAPDAGLISFGRLSLGSIYFKSAAPA